MPRIGNTTRQVATLAKRLWLLRFVACAIVSATGLSDRIASAAGQPTPDYEQLAGEARAQQQFATDAYLADLQRAERVTYAVIKAGAPYCVQQRKFSLGIPPFAMEALPQDLREGFADQPPSPTSKLPRFLNIALDSPAAKAGIQPGDVLLQMTDRATGKRPSPGWTLNRPTSTFILNEAVEVEVQRGDLKVSLKTLPQLVCDVRLQFLRTSNLVAQVDSGVLHLSQGVLRFVANDDELAYLIANELIHDQLRFARASRSSHSTSKTPERFSSADEEAADYLGAYLLIAAHFDIMRARNVWRRIASIPASHGKDSFSARHPLSPSRGVQIQVVSNDILRQAQAGERQIPDRLFSLAFSETDFRAGSALPQNDSEHNAQAAKDDPRLRMFTNLPFIDNEGIAAYQRFLDSPLRPRAFALGPAKTGRGAWSLKFGTNAAADALEHCSVFARGPCYLYAVDDKVVWNPATALDQPQSIANRKSSELLGQPKGTGFAEINDLTAVPLSADRLPIYQAFLEKPSPRAFLITQDGKGLYWIGPTAMHDALAHCARIDAPCWLYAVNNEVVWSKDANKRISHSSQLPTRNDESGFLEN
ncbi:MAG TPA: hypothetical protein VLC92_17490 [Rhodocyclaceae bacterium]|nr:hypothetical protein [Rhodocyclaceae bacterium]